MLNLVKIIAASAALLVALPSVTATCVLQQVAVYKGNYNTWNSSSNLLLNVMSPGLTTDIPQQSQNKQESCAVTCQSNVVLLITTETYRNEFYIAVNGRYLLTNRSWSLPVSNNLPLNNPQNSKPNNALEIDDDTYRSGNSGPKFFTGQWLYRSDIFSNNRWQPIYALEFPHWNCPPAPTPGQTTESQLNYIQVVNKYTQSYGYGIPGSTCTDSTLIRSLRQCSVTVRGDPQFNGLRGQDYQVHGIDGAVYNIISAPQLSVNSRFVWLDGPRDCPIIPSTGKKSVACWAHKGSYLDNLAIVNNAGAKILVQSGPADTGIALVEVNGKQISVGDSVEFGKEGVYYNSTHEVTVNAGVFSITIENSDGFVNLRAINVKAEDWAQLKSDDTHGLLGQTWRKTSSKKVIEGRVDDYLIESSDLFDSEFMYNRFQRMY